MPENVVQTIKSTNVFEAVALGAAAIIAGVMTLQKVIQSWKSTSSGTTVIETMHKEIQRMSSLNQTLANEMTNLHETIINLNREIRNIRDENQRLNSEITLLTSEVQRLSNQRLQPIRSASDE